MSALTPAFLGGASETLDTVITEKEGFVLDARPKSWRAVFGIYSPTLRGPDLVETQAQCLSSVLFGQEANISVVYLFPMAAGCGHVSCRGRNDPPCRPRRRLRLVERGGRRRW